MVTEPVIDGEAFGVAVSLRERTEPPSRRGRQGGIAREERPFEAQNDRITYLLGCTLGCTHDES